MSITIPRTLFISSYAPPAIGGPQNLYNLLRDLPTESYAVMTSFYHIDNVSAQKGDWLSGDYIFYDNPGGSRSDTEAPQASQWRRRAERLKNMIRRIGWVRVVTGIPVLFGQIMMIAREGQRAVRERGFKLLVGFSDYGPAMIGTYLVHKRTNVPFYIFLFDIYKGNYFFAPGGALLARWYEERIFRAAQKIVVTNEGTRDFYRQRYGDAVANKMVVIHNSVFPEAYTRPATPYAPHPPYTVLFTGRVYWPQIGALKNLIAAVEGITDLDVRIKIYSPQSPDHLRALGLVSDKVQFDMAPPSEMPQVQSSADILFLPLSWDTPSPDIINTATPGKLTDYLVAGRPMLIHAPATTYLVRYARENSFAQVVDVDDVASLQDGIRHLLTHPELAQALMRNAQATFSQHHDANRNATKFWELLASAHSDH